MSQIEFYRGDSYPVTLQILDKVTGEPVNIENYTFKMTVSSVKDPIDVSKNKFSINASIESSIEGKISFLPTSLNNADVGSFFYDIKMRNVSGYARTIVVDKYIVKQDIGK